MNNRSSRQTKREGTSFQADIYENKKTNCETGRRTQEGVLLPPLSSPGPAHKCTLILHLMHNSLCYTCLPDIPVLCLLVPASRLTLFAHHHEICFPQNFVCCASLKTGEEGESVGFQDAAKKKKKNIPPVPLNPLIQLHVLV